MRPGEYLPRRNSKLGDSISEKLTLSLKRTVLYSFLLSLFYETSQITALFVIYPGPYRLADVENLICNTMGGAAGYYVAAVFARVLPSRDEIDEECRKSGTRVTGMRRFWAALFDYVCITALYIFLLGAIRIINLEFTGYSIYGEVYGWSFFCIVSLLQVLITKGLTLGHASCRMILVSENGGFASAGQLIKRYLFLWIFTDVPLKEGLEAERYISCMHVTGKTEIPVESI